MSNIHIDALDRTDGNGSRSVEEEWLDQNSTAAENEWSSASTTFYYWEAPSHKQHTFKELYDKQHGKGDPNRSTELPRQRAMADTKAFCSILDLPDTVTERVTHTMENTDLSSNKSGGKSYEKIILAVISLVYDRYLSSRPPEEIQYDQRLIFDDTFQALMDSNDIGSKELRSIREQVRSNSSQF